MENIDLKNINLNIVSGNIYARLALKLQIWKAPLPTSRVPDCGILFVY